MSAAVLRAGQHLDTGHSLEILHGRVRLYFRFDGGIDLIHDDVTVWSNGSAGKAVDGRLVMQSDGNLVVYTAAGKPVWASNTLTAGAELRLVADGRAAVVKEIPRWASDTIIGAKGPVAGAVDIGPGRGLFMEQWIETSDHRVKLAVQADGNVVLNHDGKPVWASNTKTPGSGLLMQLDGHPVLRQPGKKPHWMLPRAGAGSHLALQGDGNFVLYEPHETWSAGPRLSIRYAHLVVLYTKWTKNLAGAGRTPWTLDQVIETIAPSGHDWTASDFWRVSTLGLVEIVRPSAIDLGPNGLTMPANMKGPDRAQTFNNAVDRARARGVDPADYDAVVVWIDSPSGGGALPGGVVLDEGGDLGLYFPEHEIGHVVVSWEHANGDPPVNSINPQTGATYLGTDGKTQMERVYRDPSDVMGSGWHADPNVTSANSLPGWLPPAWRRFVGPRVSAAILHRVSHLSPPPVPVGPVTIDLGTAWEKIPTKQRIYSLSHETRPSKRPVLITFVHDGVRRYLEFRRASGFDGGIGHAGVQYRYENPARIANPSTDAGPVFVDRVPEPFVGDQSFSIAKDCVFTVVGSGSLTEDHPWADVIVSSKALAPSLKLDASATTSFRTRSLAKETMTIDSGCMKGTYEVRPRIHNGVFRATISYWGIDPSTLSWSIDGVPVVNGVGMQLPNSFGRIDHVDATVTLTPVQINNPQGTASSLVFIVPAPIGDVSLTIECRAKGNDGTEVKANASVSAHLTELEFPPEYDERLVECLKYEITLIPIPNHGPGVPPELLRPWLDKDEWIRFRWLQALVLMLPENDRVPMLRALALRYPAHLSIERRTRRRGRSPRS